MHRILLLTLTFSFSAARADLKDDIASQVAAATSILESWHGKTDSAADVGRYLHIVYWTPSDREPVLQYQERLQAMMEDIQAFYGREMKRLGFGERSIDLKYGDDKKMIVHLVKGAGPYADYEMQSGSKIRKESLPVLEKAGIDADRETLVIFCNMANWDEEKKVFTHNSPYYAGGSAKGGTAWQLDSPSLKVENLKLKEPIIHDGQYGRISLGKHNSIFIGGVTHELGHALGLPHNKERADEAAAYGTALMGSGNRSYGDELRGEGKGSFLTLAHALRLASHPQFSASTKGLNFPARAEFDGFAVDGREKGFDLYGGVKSKIPVYAVVAYMDPEGGGDYNAKTTSAVPDENGKFVLSCDALVAGKAGELRLVACMANGATYQQSFAYEVDENGKPDVSGMTRRFLLEPAVEAAKARDLAGLRVVISKMDEGSFALRVAARLELALFAKIDRPGPDAWEGDVAMLTDLQPRSAKVGWMKPAYDHLPNDTVVMASAGEIFETGIYAHAPAQHIYGLNGKWKQLEGQCGIADGSRGSVVFVIKVDGQEKWRSPTTKAGKLHTYLVDVSDGKELELTTEDAGDGTGSDWGLWLDPVLTR
jgi:hypothetical protein